MKMEKWRWQLKNLLASRSNTVNGVPTLQACGSPREMAFHLYPYMIYISILLEKKKLMSERDRGERREYGPTI